ncbi:MAG: hypothetical protein J5449_01570, partial [Oscillospiraceae bacterium]|nr:hypothetical protein [Oscillospiraceae bacterium]
MSLKTREYALNRAGIPSLTEDLHSFLDSQKIQRQNALRMCLTLEELLLRIIDHGGAPDSCTLSVGRRFGRPIVILRYCGESFDPTSSPEDGGWSTLILANLGLSPEWSFRSGINTLRLRPPRQGGPSRLLWLLIAAVCAGILGAAGMLLPQETRVNLTDILLTPLFNAFLGLLNTSAGLMIFFSISSGVFGIGDTSSLSSVGKVLFPRFIISVFAVSAATLVAALPFVKL